MKFKSMVRITRAALVAAGACLMAEGSSVNAASIPYSLALGSFSQDWTNVGLITANDDWSAVPSIEGFLGDDAAGSVTGVDPQTLLVPGTGTIDVIANLANTTSSSGGVGEFEIANPVVGLQGSGTADFPNLVVYLNATGRTNIRISYNVRDIDTTADNAVQQVALQYRLSNAGNFTNVPAGYIADATTGPSLATLVTGISATNPAWDNQAILQFRILTTNAAGNDEWVGIDDVLITSDPVPEPATCVLAIAGAIAAAASRRRL